MAPDSEPPAERQGEMLREAAREAHRRILDNPARFDEPSVARHWAYFVLVIAGGTALNLIVLGVVAR
jgi:hypothetical protein